MPRLRLKVSLKRGWGVNRDAIRGGCNFTEICRAEPPRHNKRGRVEMPPETIHEEIAVSDVIRMIVRRQDDDVIWIDDSDKIRRFLVFIEAIVDRR